MVADITPYSCQLSVTGSRRDRAQVWINQLKATPTPGTAMPRTPAMQPGHAQQVLLREAHLLVAGTEKRACRNLWF